MGHSRARAAWTGGVGRLEAPEACPVNVGARRDGKVDGGWGCAKRTSSRTAHHPRSTLVTGKLTNACMWPGRGERERGVVRGGIAPGGAASGRKGRQKHKETRSVYSSGSSANTLCAFWRMHPHSASSVSSAAGRHFGRLALVRGTAERGRREDDQPEETGLEDTRV